MIRIWDTRTGRLIKAFGEENGIVYNQIEWPALDKPLMTLAGGSENIGDTVLRLWDVTSGSILMEFRGKQQGE